jgi:hypothetical protein
MLWRLLLHLLQSAAHTLSADNSRCLLYCMFDGVSKVSTWWFPSGQKRLQPVASLLTQWFELVGSWLRWAILQAGLASCSEASLVTHRDPIRQADAPLLQYADQHARLAALKLPGCQAGVFLCGLSTISTVGREPVVLKRQ